MRGNFGVNDSSAPQKPMGYGRLCGTRAIGYKGFDCIGIVNSVWKRRVSRHTTNHSELPIWLMLAVANSLMALSLR